MRAFFGLDAIEVFSTTQGQTFQNVYAISWGRRIAIVVAQFGYGGKSVRPGDLFACVKAKEGEDSLKALNKEFSKSKSDFIKIPDRLMSIGVAPELPGVRSIQDSVFDRSMFPYITDLLKENGMYWDEGTYISGKQVLFTGALATATILAMKMAQMTMVFATRNAALAVAVFPDQDSRVTRMDLKRLGLNSRQIGHFFEVSGSDQRALCKSAAYVTFCEALQDAEFYLAYALGNAT